MTDPPPSLAEVGARVAARIDDLLAGEQDRWAAVDADMAEPFRALRAIIGGGKRLRPAFCHWGFVGAGGDPDDPQVVDAGAALELLHTFAVVHDDIMDDSTRRHGQPCLHIDFADRHVARSWYGEPRRFGDGAAILIGDVAFVYADQLLRDAPATALDLFTELRLEVNVGQYLDLVGTASRRPSVGQTRTIAVYKSGKYTIERPLHLGAALTGGLARVQEAYTAFGVPLGEAFQLQDDLLDAFGDSAVLGKEAGEDLRSGKPTRLLAVARERAAPAAQAILAEGTDLHAVQTILVDTGAREAVEQRVQSLLDEALDALAAAPITEPARREMGALARFVTGRDH